MKKCANVCENLKDERKKCAIFFNQKFQDLSKVACEMERGQKFTQCTFIFCLHVFNNVH